MGTGAVLLRHVLRRDRVLVPVWLVALTGMVAASAWSVQGLYSSTAEVVAAARVVNGNPGLVALYGPILEESSLGEVAMTKLTVTYAMAVMALAVVLVRRHTRSNEESGLTELLLSTRLPRWAPWASGVAEAALVSLVVGMLAGGVNALAGLPATGSWLFGATWAGAGLVGTGLGAVACQLSASTRTCGALAAAAVLVLDLLRAAGDLGPDPLGWFSPLGWGTRAQAWGEPRWWVLALYPVTAVALILLAWVLHQRRDVGAGLVPARPGPVHGRLGGTGALLVRLTRTTALVWAVGAALAGVLFGSVTPHLGGMFSSPAGRAALEALGGRGRVEDVVTAALLAIMAALLTGFGVQVVGTVAREETDGRTELVLAAGARRSVLLVQTVALVLAGTVLLAAVYATGAAVGYGSQTGGVGPAIERLLPAAAAHVPAMWVLLAATVLAWVVRPRAAWVGWALLLGAVLLGEVGQLLELPDWVTGASPFQHVADVPVVPVDPRAEVGLVLVAAVLVGTAWWRQSRRDIG